MEKTYVQYGCGLWAPKEWINYDVSPTLRIQKIPLIGRLVKRQLNARFPTNVFYGDIVTGLPLRPNSCDGLYCSHTLEHLTLQDFRIALKNSHKILKRGGIFRCIVPDLEYLARIYIQSLENGDCSASIKFVGDHTHLGIEKRPRGLKQLLNAILGNSHHLWMWDSKSLAKELKNAGFTSVRVCQFNDSNDEMFRYVEDLARFEGSVAIECIKE